MTKLQKFFTGVAVIALALILTIALSGNQSNTNQVSTNNPVKVGVLLPFSGDSSVFGKKGRRGLELVESEEINFVYQDTKGLKARGAVNAARKLINTDNVDMLIGPFGPEQTFAVEPVASKQNMPMFSYSLCSKRFAEYENIWCGYPSTSQQLAETPDFMAKQGIETVALVTEQSDYGRESAEVIRTEASNVGYEVAIDEKISTDLRDFRTLATQITSESPDAVFVATASVPQNFLLMEQLNQLGYEGARFAGAADTDVSHVEQFGDAVEGVYVSGSISPERFAQSFYDRFQEKYGEKPDLYSAIAYDMGRYALKSSQNYSGDISTIDNMNEFGQTVTNINYKNPAIPGYQFAEDRTVSFPTEIWQIQDGEYVPVLN